MSRSVYRNRWHAESTQARRARRRTQHVVGTKIWVPPLGGYANKADKFDSLDSAFWTTDATASVSGGKLVLTPPPNLSEQYGAHEIGYGNYTIEDSYVVFERKQLFDAASGIVNCYVFVSYDPLSATPGKYGVGIRFADDGFGNIALGIDARWGTVTSTGAGIYDANKTWYAFTYRSSGASGADTFRAWHSASPTGPPPVQNGDPFNGWTVLSSVARVTTRHQLHMKHQLWVYTERTGTVPTGTFEIDNINSLPTKAPPPPPGIKRQPPHWVSAPRRERRWMGVPQSRRRIILTKTPVPTKAPPPPQRIRTRQPPYWITAPRRERRWYGIPQTNRRRLLSLQEKPFAELVVSFDDNTVTYPPMFADANVTIRNKQAIIDPTIGDSTNPLGLYTRAGAFNLRGSYLFVEVPRAVADQRSIYRVRILFGDQRLGPTFPDSSGLSKSRNIVYMGVDTRDTTAAIGEIVAGAGNAGSFTGTYNPQVHRFWAVVHRDTGGNGTLEWYFAAKPTGPPPQTGAASGNGWTLSRSAAMGNDITRRQQLYITAHGVDTPTAYEFIVDGINTIPVRSLPPRRSRSRIPPRWLTVPRLERRWYGKPMSRWRWVGTAFISDSTPPTASVTSVSVTKISRVAGKDVADVTFTTDEDFVEYEVRVVPDPSSGRGAGNQLETATVSARSSHSIQVTDDELVAAAGSEGTNVIKVFVKDAAGNWST